MSQPPPMPSQQTPAPRRFFLPKRGTPSQSQAQFQAQSQSQTHTPAATAAAAMDGPRFQFQSTPRFGPPSASRSSQQRQVAGWRGGVEDVEEEDDIVEESSLEEEDDDDDDVDQVVEDEDERGIKVRRDRTEVYSPISSSGGSRTKNDVDDEARDKEQYGGRLLEEPEPADSEGDDGSNFSGRRDIKRRRISISPPSSHGSPTGYQHDDALRNTYEDSDEEGGILGGKEQEEQGDKEEMDDTPQPSDASDLDDADSPTRDRPLQQPTFRAAPRFKVLDKDAMDVAEGLLPPAFSPQRPRGARYVTGGLASQMQGWLSEVKGWSGGMEGWSGSGKFTILLEDVRPGRRMYLTQHSGMLPHSGTAAERSRQDSSGGRLVLAGEGTLTGLGQSADVKAGSLVEVRRPVWDIVMDGCTWMVACDWTVQ